MAASVVDYSNVAQPNRTSVREALLGVVAAPAQLSTLTSSASTLARTRLVLPFIVCERSLRHPPFRLSSPPGTTLHLSVAPYIRSG